MADRKRQNILSSFILISGVAAVSTGAIFARLAEAPPLAIAAYRLGIATLVLGGPAMYFKKAELLGLSRKILLHTLGAGFFLALHFATWISSLSYTSVASSVVLVNTIPLWTALMGPMVTGEKLSRRATLGVLISFSGSVVVGAGDFSLSLQALQGDSLALLGGFAASCYIMLGKKVRPVLSLQSYTFLCYGSGAGFLWLGLLFSGLSLGPYTPRTWWAFAGMALISQIIGHSSYNWSLRWFSSNTVAVTLLGEPLGSAILAYFILGESISPVKALGGALVLAGIYLTALEENTSQVPG